jgi:hypothetical protein
VFPVPAYRNVFPVPSTSPGPSGIPRLQVSLDYEETVREAGHTGKGQSGDPPKGEEIQETEDSRIPDSCLPGSGANQEAQGFVSFQVQASLRENNHRAGVAVEPVWYQHFPIKVQVREALLGTVTRVSLPPRLARFP